MRRCAAATILLLMMIVSNAVAESFVPLHTSQTGYTQTQWLSNGMSRALLVCMASKDYCDAAGSGFKNLSTLITQNTSYIYNSGNTMDVYIMSGSQCLRIRIKFDKSAASAKASKCSAGDIGSGEGWYEVSSEDCATVLAD